MPSYFRESGFAWPETQIYVLVGRGLDSIAPSYVVHTLRSIAPLLIKTGVATAAELGLDTLEARLHESSATGAPSIAVVDGGVWVRRI